MLQHIHDAKAQRELGPVPVATGCQEGIQGNDERMKTSRLPKSTETDRLKEIGGRLHECIGFEELDVAASDLVPVRESGTSGRHTLGRFGNTGMIGL